MTGRTLPLAEYFGPTIQGEGPAAGRPAWFVRFGACNLSCSWCDTPYTWDATRYDLRREIGRVPVDDVVAAVTTDLVVLTGGEPLLHQGSDGWQALLEQLVARRKQVHIETNGTIPPRGGTLALLSVSGGHLAVVSPKLQYAEAGRRTGADPINADALAAWAHLADRGRAVVKFVVRTALDMREALDTADRHGFPRSSVWLMPEGTTALGLSMRWRLVAEFAAKHGVNASHRLHVLAWRDERGH